MAKVYNEMDEITRALRASKELVKSNTATIKYNGMNVHIVGDCPLCGKNLVAKDIEDESTGCNCDHTVYARDVITDPERRFIADELLNKLKEIIKYYMRYDIYDPDKDGIVNYSDRAVEADMVQWENVIGKPDLDPIKIANAIKYTHHHLNKEAIDMIGFNVMSVEPMWNDEEWPYPISAKELPLDQLVMRNIYISPDRPVDAYTGDIWIKVEPGTNKIVGIEVKKNLADWYRLDLTELVTNIANQIIQNLLDDLREFIIDDHEKLKNLQGGTTNEHYHLTYEEWYILRKIVEEYKKDNPYVPPKPEPKPIIEYDVDGGPAPEQVYVFDFDGGFAGTDEYEYTIDLDGGGASEGYVIPLYEPEENKIPYIFDAGYGKEGINAFVYDGGFAGTIEALYGEILDAKFAEEEEYEDDSHVYVPDDDDDDDEEEDVFIIDYDDWDNGFSNNNIFINEYDGGFAWWVDQYKREGDGGFASHDGYNHTDKITDDFTAGGSTSKTYSYLYDGGFANTSEDLYDEILDGKLDD